MIAYRIVTAWPAVAQSESSVAQLADSAVPRLAALASSLAWARGLHRYLNSVAGESKPEWVERASLASLMESRARLSLADLRLMQAAHLMIQRIAVWMN